MGEPEKLTSKKLLAVEGNDDANFFKALCKEVKLTGIQVFGVRGKDQLAQGFPDIRNLPRFDQVSHMGIVRAADGNKEGALESVQGILSSKFGYSEIPGKHGVFTNSVPKLGIFIMPGEVDGTMIEDLCLKTVEKKPEYECVDDFIECVKGKRIEFRNESKSKSQAFLAAQAESFPHLGVAALNKIWDFSDPCLDELKAFLEHFC